jgi:hypothetical protein
LHGAIRSKGVSFCFRRFGAMPTRPHPEAAMADESKQQNQDGEQDDSTEESTDATTEADKPGAALLKALATERERANKAEADLRKRDAADRKAETDRAIKAGEWEAVAKAKDGEIADLNQRIAELEGGDRHQLATPSASASPPSTSSPPSWPRLRGRRRSRPCERRREGTRRSWSASPRRTPRRARGATAARAAPPGSSN